MKFRLEAFSPTEGVGLVRVGPQLRLARPPYVIKDSPVLEESAVAEAILKNNYSSCDLEFASWEQVTLFLSEQVVNSRKILGHHIPEAINDEEIIKSAPLEVLVKFLDDVENELIPAGAFEKVEDALTTLLSVESVGENADLSRRAARLFRRNKLAREKGSSAPHSQTILFVGDRSRPAVPPRIFFALPLRDGCVSGRSYFATG